MSPTAETSIPTSSLFPDRYGLKKSAVYQALKDLKIERFKGATGNAAYISFEDLAILDKYMKVLKEEGRQAADAYAAELVESSTEDSTALSAPQSTEDSTIAMPTDISVFAEMIALISRQISRELLLPASETLAPQRQLKEASEEGWLLSTGQVRDIVGVKGWSGSDRYGFSFEKVGKIGGQSGWRVVKL